MAEKRIDDIKVHQTT